MLERHARSEAVQLAWHGLRRQLSLFVTAQGRCVLFQQQRLAAFLQAGLLLPAQDESLTVRATRTALAKLDADPSRLLN
jgi:urease accessory protein UreE